MFTQATVLHAFDFKISFRVCAVKWSLPVWLTDMVCICVWICVCIWEEDANNTNHQKISTSCCNIFAFCSKAPGFVFDAYTVDNVREHSHTKFTQRQKWRSQVNLLIALCIFIRPSPIFSLLAYVFICVRTSLLLLIPHTWSLSCVSSSSRLSVTNPNTSSGTRSKASLALLTSNLAFNFAFW